jgi:glycosyltransferase involved in cell wall biosynthesis
MPACSPGLVSLIVPAHNVGGYLPKCLNSLITQTYKHLEIIVINDRSDEDTGSILDDYAARERRVKAIHLSVNVGVHAARMLGVEASSGEHVGFVDADDWVHPRMFESLLQACIKSDADIAICGVKTASEEGLPGPEKVRFPRDEVVMDEILQRFCRLELGTGVLWNKLYKRELIFKYGTQPLDRSVDASEDYIVNVGCFAESKKIALLRDCLYYYLQRRESASRSAANAAAFVRILRAYETCLRVYADRGEKFLVEIDCLYARQLSFDCYKVADLSLLDAHQAELTCVVQQLMTTRPKSIYALIHKNDEVILEDKCARPLFRELIRRVLRFATTARALF